MTHRTKLLGYIAAALVVLLLAIGITLVQIAKTQWFREFARNKIASVIQNSVGGRTEIGNFSLTWSPIEATVDSLVIHGKEPATVKPFVRVERIRVRVRLFESFRQILRVTFLSVERPEINVIVDAQGNSNLPTPPQKASSNSNPLETVVNLAVTRLDLNRGSLNYNAASQPLDLQANNLTVRLAFNRLRQNYQGQISLQPIYVSAGRQTPVIVTVTVPIDIGRNSIAIEDARISTGASELKISGALENLQQARTSAQVEGRIALQDIASLTNSNLARDANSEVSALLLNAKAVVDQDRINLESFHLSFGRSSIDSRGALKDVRGSGALRLQVDFDLPQLSRIAHLKQELTGNAALTAAVRFDGKTINADPIRFQAFGTELNAKALVEELARYRVEAQIPIVDLQAAEQRAGIKPLPYTGKISVSANASGNLKSTIDNMVANATVTISPGNGGIPVSGQAELSYDGPSGDIRSAESSIRLPHSSLAFSGSLQRELLLHLTSQDLHDLLAAVPSLDSGALKLNGGRLDLQATARGTTRSPVVRGKVSVDRIAIQNRRFDTIGADFSASSLGVSVENGSIRRDMMRAQFSGSVGLQNWTVQQRSPVNGKAAVNQADLADIVALAGQPTTGYSGEFTANANLDGTVANPIGMASVRIMNGTIRNEPFDQIQLNAALTDQRVAVPSAFVTLDAARIDLTANYAHPPEQFTNGHLTAQIRSNSIDLGQMHHFLSRHPKSSGRVTLDATLAGDVQNKSDATQFVPTDIRADVTTDKLKLNDQEIGDTNLRASTSGNTVDYVLTWNRLTAQLRANGRTQLVSDYPTTLDANVTKLQIEPILQALKRMDIRAKGTLDAGLHLTGTVKQPSGNLRLDITGANLYDESLDRVSARVEYLPTAIHITQFDAVSGRDRVSLTASFDHPSGDLNQGDLQFKLQSSRLELGRLRILQKVRPGLAGALEVNSDGKIFLRPGQSSADFIKRLDVKDLNADIQANRLSIEGKNIGDANVTAKTSSGRLNFALTAAVVNGRLKADGQAQLAGDYPVNAQLNFDRLSWADLQPIVGTRGTSSFDAETSGQVTLNGPLSRSQDLGGSLRLTSLQIRPVRQSATLRGTPFVLKNQGDVSVRLDRGQVRIENAHFIAPETDINASGAGSVKGENLNFKVDADADLRLLETFSPDVFSSGKVVLASTVQGSIQKPQLNGRLELQNASVSSADLPTGLSNANGTVNFNSNTATIQNLSAESGGGKIVLSGFITREDQLRFSLRANAMGVRVRAQQGVSVALGGTVNLTGTAQNSVASGNVTVDRITYAPQTDLGSLLTRAGPPMESPSAPSPVLANMNLDIQVRTSSGTAVQASLAQNLTISADLRVRGKASQPAVLGTVRLSQGQLVFFGSTYRISNGTISFFNPNRIEPILDIVLETQAKGVNVVLSVTGPVDDMKLSYTSDPPLQFDEIVSLLAAGKAPTSDPTLLANQPSTPPQSLQQRGESALVSKAIADPISNRLQRVFGVSQLKIDPTFTSGSQIPQARVTLQQQVATNLVFTYVTALDNPNTQVVRIEWSMNPQWSAIANRDENGLVSINLLYKRQFR